MRNNKYIHEKYPEMNLWIMGVAVLIFGSVTLYSLLSGQINTRLTCERTSLQTIQCQLQSFWLDIPIAKPVDFYLQGVHVEEVEISTSRLQQRYTAYKILLDTDRGTIPLANYNFTQESAAEPLQTISEFIHNANQPKLLLTEGLQSASWIVPTFFTGMLTLISLAGFWLLWHKQQVKKPAKKN